MSTEDLIAMARQAGAFPDLSTTPDKDVEFLRRFAKLIEARTREECASLNVTPLGILASDAPAAVIEKYRAAIRAMGERT